MFYIIEHTRRGTFREMDHDWRAGKRIHIPRFSSSGMRGDPDKEQQFPSVEAARAMFDRIVSADGGRMTKDLKVRRSSDWKYICLDCRAWCESWHDHLRNCPVYREEVARHER